MGEAEAQRLLATGETKIVENICHQCPARCGIDVYVTNDRVHAIYGTTGRDVPRSPAHLPRRFRRAASHSPAVLRPLPHPTAPVQLNTSFYLGGSVLGGSEYEMRQWFARHGLSGNTHAGALADQVGATLEFVAELFRRASRSISAGDPMEGLAQAAEARRFLAAYPRRWLAPLRAACAMASTKQGYAPAYAHLLDILAGALDVEVVKEAAKSPEAALITAYPAGSSRGIGEPTAEDLAEIAVRLQESRLSFDHIRQRPEWREDVFQARCSTVTLHSN